MQTLESMTDEAMYEIMSVNMPALVAAVTDLIKAGQTPAQIEQAMVAKYGETQTTRNVRHVAEYVARTTLPAD